MLNRKDLMGGVMLGGVLSCVLFVGAVTTSANASLIGAHHGQQVRDVAQQANDAANTDDRTASRN